MGSSLGPVRRLGVKSAATHVDYLVSENPALGGRCGE